MVGVKIIEAGQFPPFFIHCCLKLVGAVSSTITIYCILIAFALLDTVGLKYLQCRKSAALCRVTTLFKL